MSHSAITKPVENYYTGKVLLHGTHSLGVDWKSRESQELRFDQILKVCRGKKFSILDWGCGYGYLFEYLKRKRVNCSYRGYDLSKEMIRRARRSYGKSPGARFQEGEPAGHPADYVVASGIFNVKLKTPQGEWKKYIIGLLDHMNRLARKGFSFNCLTKYSDKERMRSDLYYADPLFFFDHCKRNFSKNVSLLHDYGLYEFTMLVRKDL